MEARVDMLERKVKSLTKIKNDESSTRNSSF